MTAAFSLAPADHRDAGWLVPWRHLIGHPVGRRIIVDLPGLGRQVATVVGHDSDDYPIVTVA